MFSSHPQGETMADSPDSISAWPSSPEVLADVHLCPGCFTQITLPECPVCGFVLTDPRALEVLQLGRAIVIAETDRQRIIEAVRLDYRRAPAEVIPVEPADHSGAVFGDRADRCRRRRTSGWPSRFRRVRCSSISRQQPSCRHRCPPPSRRQSWTRPSPHRWRRAGSASRPFSLPLCRPGSPHPSRALRAVASACPCCC